MPLTDLIITPYVMLSSHQRRFDGALKRKTATAKCKTAPKRNKA